MIKVSVYDNDFITLNPYTFCIPEGCFSSMMESKELDKKFKAGTTNSQITLGRRTVESIKMLFFEE